MSIAFSIQKRTAFVLAVAATVVAATAHAEWPRDPNAGNVPICTQASYQDGARTMPDGAGGVFIVWHDYRDGGVQPDLYMQHLDANGTPMWTPQGKPLVAHPAHQLDPSIVTDAAGGFIVAWEDSRNGAYDIYAQRVSPSGVTLWAENGVPLCQAPVGQFYARTVADGLGGAIVMWRDNRVPGNSDIFAQRVNAQGVVQWALDGVGLCNATSSQSPGDAVTDGAGGAIVVWEDYRSGTAEVYAQRVNASGVPQWTTDGLLLCTAADAQRYPRGVSDGVGGLIVTWEDQRLGSANVDVYAQRVSPTGAALWGSNGLILCGIAGFQGVPVLGSDGSGGAIVSWWDQRSGAYDVYAQRVTANGMPQWAANGVLVCGFTGDQLPRNVLGDGSGGAIIQWDDRRSLLSYDLYAQRVDRNGNLKWTGGGVAITAAVGNQFAYDLVSDGANGLITAFNDYRNGNTPDIYAQRVDRFGQLGQAEPRITAVADVLDDQGGTMKLSFASSYLDEEGFDPDLEYTVWRSVPASQLQALESVKGVTSDPDEARSFGRLLVLETGVPNLAWELVGEVAAFGLPAYSFLVPTTGDSIAGSNPRTTVMVMVHDQSAGSAYWASAPDSGYSVDNLAPATPASFVAQRSESGAELTWQPNLEADFASYRLYRGATSDFEPSPENLLCTRTEVGYQDATGTPYFYRLTAVDIHGNESEIALAGSGATAAVGDAGAMGIHFAPPSPNPARGSALLRWALPRASHVSLEVFDAAGRRVRTLLDGPLNAGEHSLRFDLTSDAGTSLASGLYMVRLRAEGSMLTRRVMAVR